jgi:RNA polymerase sigma-70 factor (ECF subfamily)
MSYELAAAIAVPQLRVLRGSQADKKAESRRMTESVTDGALVERAARGDSIAFSELVNRHYKKAVRTAFGLLKDRHDAEDVAQEAFARVYRKLESFQGQSAFYTWLYRIVVNLSIDALRKKKRERRADVDDESAREALRSVDDLWPRYDDGDPATAVERSELAGQLRKAFEDLPEIHQAVLLLREVQGFSYEEIAETLDIKKGTVMSRLFHARKAMQTKLSAEFAKELRPVSEVK